MNRLFMFLSLIVTGPIWAQLKPYLFQIKSDTIIQWTYQFGDEFKAKEVDLTKWYPRYPWGGLLLDQSQWAVPEMLEQKDGWLILSAIAYGQKTAVPNWMINQEQAKKLQLDVKNDSVKLDYLTSCIWSIDTFKYGYFECRAIVPSGKGLWPAFWLFGQNGKDEIDIMECKGERPFDVHVDIHLPEKKDFVNTRFGFKKNWGGWVKMQIPLINDTVIFSGVWLPNSLTYFVNGRPISHFDGDFSTPMNVIANLAVARDNYPFNPGPDEFTQFPASYKVDYIRVWKLDALNSSKNLTQLGPSSSKPINHKTDKIIKKKIPHVYPKKLLQKELGFISFIPISDNKYRIETNGIESSQIELLIEDVPFQYIDIIDFGTLSLVDEVIISVNGMKYTFNPFK